MPFLSEVPTGRDNCGPGRSPASPGTERHPTKRPSHSRDRQGEGVFLIFLRGGTGGSSASALGASGPVYRDHANDNRIYTPTTMTTRREDQPPLTCPWRGGRSPRNYRRVRANPARPANLPTALIQQNAPKSCGQNVSRTASLAHTPRTEQKNPAPYNEVKRAEPHGSP